VKGPCIVDKFNQGAVLSHISTTRVQESSLSVIRLLYEYSVYSHCCDNNDHSGALIAG
jgi:hypothetical protein